MRPKQRMLVERLRLRTCLRSHRNPPTRVNNRSLSKGYHIGQTNAQTRPARTGRFVPSVRKAASVR